jgi:hypothetical protein
MLDYELLNKKADNFPIYFGIDKYQRAIDSFVDKIGKATCVKSVYRIGSIESPGISDIDLYIVFDDHISSHYGAFSVKNICSKEERYFFLHDPGFVNSHLFENIFEWNPVFQLRKVYGENIEPNKKINKVNLHHIGILVKILITKIPRVIIAELSRPKINIRLLIMQLNSFKHTIALYQEITGDDNDELQMFVEEITEIRNSWFENSRRTNILRLTECINNLVSAVSLLITTTTMYLREFDFVDKFVKQLKAYRKIEFSNHYFRTNFIRIGNDFDVLKDYIREGNGLQIYLPLELAYFLYCHRDSQTRLKDCTYGKIPEFVNVKCDNALIDYIKYIDEYILFSRKIRYWGVVEFSFGAGHPYIVRKLKVLGTKAKRLLNLG